MGTYYAHGIILSHQDFREADRLLTVYTSEYGKLKLIARGSRKGTSKLAGKLEPFARTRLWIAHGKHFDTVAASDVEQRFRAISSDLEKTYCAHYLASVVDCSVNGRQRDERIFNLIEQALEELQREGSAIGHYRIKLVWFFVWQLLSYLGYHPELYTCPRCKKPLEHERNYFSLGRGCIICPRCQGTERTTIAVSPAGIKVLRVATSNPWQDIRRLRITAALVRELNALTESYLEYVLERSIPLSQFSPPR